MKGEIVLDVLTNIEDKRTKKIGFERLTIGEV
jgi:hypothetical protein